MSLRKHSSLSVVTTRLEALEEAARQLVESVTFLPAPLGPELGFGHGKLGIITPLHEDGIKTEALNHRPESFLLLFKFMESIVADMLLCYLENCNIIAPE